MLKFVYLKDMEYMYSFNISVVDGGVKGEQVKGGVDFTAVIPYKNPFMVNRNQ